MEPIGTGFSSPSSCFSCSLSADLYVLFFASLTQGPAVVVGTDEGAVYAWDLSGHDKGQIYAEMRSLSPIEVPSH